LSRKGTEKLRGKREGTSWWGKGRFVDAVSKAGFVEVRSGERKGGGRLEPRRGKGISVRIVEGGKTGCHLAVR